MSNFQRIENKEKYLQLFNKVLFKTFFHSLEWEEFLEKQFKWLKFEHYLYEDQVLLSLARYNFLGKEKLISHPFCEYGGFLPLKTDINGRKLKANLLEKFKCEFKIKFHPQIPKHFQEFGLKEPDSISDAYFIEDLDKKNKNEIYSNFRKTLRHSIEKAEKQNIEIKKCHNQKELKEFYKLYVKTIKRHKNIPYPYAFFQFFLNSNYAEVILAQYDKKIIAGSIFLFYDGFIHYFLNASDYNHKEKQANYLILWSQIKKYVGKDYKVFDFGGTGRGSSLEVFKKGWGTKKYSIFELKNFQDNKIKKSKLRNILAFLPNSISAKFLKFKI